MAQTIEYFLSPVSPWTYLGHERFLAIAARHGAEVKARPMALGAKIFPVSGGLPLAQRPAQRQAYRLVELARWSGYLDLPLNLHPRHFPVADAPASRMIVAAEEVSTDAALRLTGAILRAVWAEEENVADAHTLTALASRVGLDGARLLERSRDAAIGERFDAYTQEAIDKQVFGAPSYLLNGEIFWGQDRLDFLDRALAAAA